jgi:hypothetical protein
VAAGLASHAISGLTRLTALAQVEGHFHLTGRIRLMGGNRPGVRVPELGVFSVCRRFPVWPDVARRPGACGTQEAVTVPFVTQVAGGNRHVVTSRRSGPSRCHIATVRSGPGPGRLRGGAGGQASEDAADHELGISPERTVMRGISPERTADSHEGASHLVCALCAARRRLRMLWLVPRVVRFFRDEASVAGHVPGRGRLGAGSAGGHARKPGSAGHARYRVAPGTRDGHGALYGHDEDRGPFARNASVCAKGVPRPVF